MIFQLIFSLFLRDLISDYTENDFDVILSSMAECRTQLTRIQRSTAQSHPDISEQMKLIKEDVQKVSKNSSFYGISSF